jgi:hypothetical protein
MCNLESYAKKSDSELLYIIRDAGEAAQAMRGHAPEAEAKYLDQVNDASTIMYQRRRANQAKYEVVMYTSAVTGNNRSTACFSHAAARREAAALKREGAVNVRIVGDKNESA